MAEIHDAEEMTTARECRRHREDTEQETGAENGKVDTGAALDLHTAEVADTGVHQETRMMICLCRVGRRGMCPMFRSSSSKTLTGKMNLYSLRG